MSNKKDTATPTVAVSRDVAEKDVNRWLDHKKIGQSKRERYLDNIEILIDSVQDGQLIVLDNCHLRQNLMLPPENEDGEVKIDGFDFVPRIHFSQIQPKLKGIKPGDSESRLLGYAAALCGQPRGVLAKLDTVDLAITQAIAVFFL